MDTTASLALFGTLLALAVVPGPSDAAVVARAISAGFAQAGLMVVGIVVADAVFILIAALGLAGLADLITQFADAARYLAVGLITLFALVLLKPPQSLDTPASVPATHKPAASFAAGFLITLADPKAIGFYLLLLPGFVQEQKLGWQQALLILLVATLAICSVKLSYAWMAARARHWFASPRVLYRIQCLASGLLVLVAITLLQA